MAKKKTDVAAAEPDAVIAPVAVPEPVFDPTRSIVLEGPFGDRRIVSVGPEEAKARMQVIGGKYWYHKAEDAQGRWIYRCD